MGWIARWTNAQRRTHKRQTSGRTVMDRLKFYNVQQFGCGRCTCVYRKRAKYAPKRPESSRFSLRERSSHRHRAGPDHREWRRDTIKIDLVQNFIALQNIARYRPPYRSEYYSQWCIQEFFLGGLIIYKKKKKNIITAK